MEEESFFSKAVHAVIFIVICAVILSIGWNEPLRYRFLTPQQIAEIEGPPPATPVPQPTPFFGERLQGTRLDEGPGYKSRGRGTIYSLPYRKTEKLEPPPDRRDSGR